MGSIWDEGFFSMVSDDQLDYEFDENDRLTNAEDTLQGYIKHEDLEEVSNSMPPNLDSKSSYDNKKLLNQVEREEKPILDNKNVLEDLSRNCSVKTERRDSTVDSHNTADNQITIDARIFLDPYNQSLNSVSSNSITNDRGSQTNLTRRITSQNQSQQIDENCKVSSTKKSSSRRKKLNDSGISHVDRKCGKKAESKRQKSKKFALSNFTVHSSPDKKKKLKKSQIKVEPDVLLSPRDGKKEDTFERVEFEENVKLNIDKRNIEQPKLNGPQASTKEKSSKAKSSKTKDMKLLPKNLNKHELSLGRKDILPIKLESNVQSKVQPTSNNSQLNAQPNKLKKVERPSGAKNILKYGSNLKLEPALNNLFDSKLVLERLPDDIVHSTPVHTGSDRIKPKEEVIDRKPMLHLKLQHLPKARVVLKKLTEEDLRSPASLFRRVKNEINENISQKLRSQGKARNKDFIQLYCCKCKSLQVDRSGYTKSKNCDDCDSQLIYVCMKCSEKHYVTYNHLHRHLKKCRGSGENKPRDLESIVLHRCTQCTFKTTNVRIMASHMKNKKHKANGEIDVDEVLKSPQVRVKREVSNEPPVSPKIPRTRYAKLIIKQNNTSARSITERYCVTCNKPRSSKTRKPKESCHRCKTQLHLRCLKCNHKCCSYDMMLKHLRFKCQPNEFKCAKCNYTNSVWLQMQQHVMEGHGHMLSKSDLKSKSKKRRREVFGCSLCDFCSYYQHSVTRHMKNLHKK